ncbi:hypothetical protein M3Y97_00427300 [Aphelenchoides bicaudatus]|nr:hypothetical protein M3Y97_00427300 [Aphelenchoides bicaudatus]
MVNIEDFSDQQLKESLLEHGVNVPVTPTTRKVCENKLKKLLASGHATPKQASQSADFSDGGGAYRRNVFSEERQSSRNNVSELSDQSDNEGEVSARNLSKHERAAVPLTLPRKTSWKQYLEIRRHCHSIFDIHQLHRVSKPKRPANWR